MAREFEDLQRIRSTLLLALLTLVVAFPIYAQSNPGNSIAAEPKVSPSPQEPKKPMALNPGAEPIPPQTPEGLRQAEIEADTKRLYQLSADLRAEVARTYKETLSLRVIKKAEEVEKLAKSLKVLMSKEAAASKH